MRSRRVGVARHHAALVLQQRGVFRRVRDLDDAFGRKRWPCVALLAARPSTDIGTISAPNSAIEAVRGAHEVHSGAVRALIALWASGSAAWRASRRARPGGRRPAWPLVIGRLLPRASRMPPTTDVTANTTLSSVTRSGEAVTRIAAAAGVTRSARTRSAPTTWMETATVRPSSTMKTGERIPHGHAPGGGDVGVQAGEDQRPPDHRQGERAPRRTCRPASSSATVSTATIWPVSRPNLLAARPLYRSQEQHAQAEAEGHRGRR